MDSFVGTLLSLPLEAQAIGAISLAIVVMTAARLFRPRSGSSEERDELPSSPPSPVAWAPPTPPAEPPSLESRTMDAAHQPLEQIDLLSPAHDTPVPVARIDRRQLADAKRRIEIVVARTGGPGPSDNLTAINGLSPSHAQTLYRMGLRSFSQLGQLEREDLEAVSVLLACPVEQITSDDWVGQARRHA